MLKKKPIISRVLRGFILALIVGLFIGVPVLAAVPSDVTYAAANPSSTSVSLLWTPSSGATKTMVRYLTTGFPNDPTGVGDGSILVYYNTSNNHVLTGLTAGTTYYFSFWGWNADGYSTNPYEIPTTTTGVAPTGDPLPTPTVPSNMYQIPKSSSWFDNLQPFSGAIAYFAADWGMPINNMMLAVSVVI
jgi:hypothetical protein